MKPVLLAYSNCQGLSLLKFFSLHPNLQEFERVHLPAWKGARPPEGVAERCKIVIYQKSFGVPDFLADMKPDTRMVSFPTVSCSVLFPNTFNRPEDPVGWRFPYGDRFLAAKIKEGLPPAQAADAYLAQDIPGRLDLQRLIQFEFAKWDKLDADHDVKMADFLKERFLRQRLFFTPDHPTDVAMIELTNRILARLDLPGFAEPNWDRHGHTLNNVEVPIHPTIIDALNLPFVAKDHRYALWGGAVSCGGHEWWRRYAEALSHPGFDESLAEAARAIEAGDLASALNICTAIRYREDRHPRALATQAVIHGMLGQRQQAAELLSQAFPS